MLDLYAVVWAEVKNKTKPNEKKTNLITATWKVVYTPLLVSRAVTFLFLRKMLTVTLFSAFLRALQG